MPRTWLPRARPADQVRKAGQGKRARELYEQSLAIAQRLTDDKPGKTTDRRDLPVSFNKPADLAREAGQCDQARQRASRTLDVQRCPVPHQARFAPVDSGGGVGLCLTAGPGLTADLLRGRVRPRS